MSKGNNNLIKTVMSVLACVLLAVVIMINRKNMADDTETAAMTMNNTDTGTVTRYTFRNEELLEQHYEKHGEEMGFASASEYEAAASDVINNSKALVKTEKEDGDMVYYLEETNEFVILSSDGYIRTYFWPSAGKDYYDRQ